MLVKGAKMTEQNDFDASYHYFKNQIINHHNSEPFIVKGVGEAAKRNMDYLLLRAQQELNVYFKRIPAPRVIELNGK